MKSFSMMLWAELQSLTFARNIESYCIHGVVVTRTVAACFYTIPLLGSCDVGF